MKDPKTDAADTSDAAEQPTLLQAAGSAAAAMFGVQSSKNRKRDFKSSSPARFIVMGAVMTAVFILTVLFAVRCALLQTPPGN